MAEQLNIRTPAYRVPRSRGMDPATRRLALIAAGLGGTLLALIGAWSITGNGGSGGGVPVVAAPTSPLRVKPANPGGMKVSGIGDPLFSGNNGTADLQDSKLAPGPETPDPGALRAAAKPTAAPTSTPAAAPATAPLPVPPTPVARTQTQPQSVATTGIGAAARQPAAQPSAAPARAAPATHGARMVQLGALPTEAAARAQWAHLQRLLPELMRGRRLALSHVEVGGRVWWRVRTAGFPDAAAARDFCKQARAKGAACDVAAF